MARRTPASVKETAKLARRVRVAELYLTGVRNLADIARRLDAPYQTVLRDLNLIREQWKLDAAELLGKALAEQLAKLDKIEREAWAEWERSKLPAETVSTKGDEQTTTVKGRCGDPQYLERVQWCIDRRCKLLGLDAPLKIENTTPLETVEIVVQSRDEYLTVQQFIEAARSGSSHNGRGNGHGNGSIPQQIPPGGGVDSGTSGENT